MIRRVRRKIKRKDNSYRKSEKGLSTIVATLLIILVTIVAVGIIWVVIRNVIQNGAEQISLGKITLDLKISQIRITSYTDVNITVKRNSGRGEFSGIVFVAYDESNSEMIRKNVSLNELESRNFQVTLSVVNTSKIKKISIAPVFTLASGKQVVGDIKDEYIFNSKNSIIQVCVSDCPSGAQCGIDSCGKDCGAGCTNPNFPICSNYQCAAQTCIPNCPTGAQCGYDGCTGNCGTCPSLPNSISQCNAGYQCEIQSCIFGYDNCDLNTANGCEVNLQTNNTNCGSCGHTCLAGETCTAGVCIGCVPTTFSPSLNTFCGSQSVTTNCGTGTYTGTLTCTLPNTCGGLGIPNACGCTVSTFNPALNTFCGSQSVTTNCGVQTLSGTLTCTSPQTCGGSGTPNTCGCTVSSYNPLLNTFCGSQSVTTNCGVQTLTGTLTCTLPNTCGGLGIPNACGCTVSSYNPLLNTFCGNKLINTNCGSGTYTGTLTCTSPQTCGGSGTPNTCGCTATTFSPALNTFCGSQSVTTNCGVQTLSGTLTCTLPNTCGGLGIPNACGCTVSSYNPLLNTFCGNKLINTNCGSGTYTGTLTCTSPQTCGGSGTPNTCGCTATTFNPALNTFCGSQSVTTNCGVQTLSGTLTCTLPNTCGGLGIPNACGCTVSTFNPALNTFCGSQSVTTNCGTGTYTGTLTCTSPQTCGGSGTPNICGTSSTTTWTGELLTNPGFELGNLNGWTTFGINWVVGMGPTTYDSGNGAQAGSYCAFRSASVNNDLTSYIYQDVDLISYASYISSGTAVVNASGWGVSAEFSSDFAGIQILFLDSSRNVIITALNTGMNQTAHWWKAGINNYIIPANTRYIRMWGNTYEPWSDGGSLDSFSVKVGYGGACIPTTCSALGYNCGSWSDGCSGNLICGSYGGGCQSGYTCGADGQCAVTQILSGVKYYINATTGSDTNNGKLPSTPWKTMKNINSTTGSAFQPGDKILFERGQTWRETLTVPRSGNLTNYITFGSYGSGNRPRILGSTKGITWTLTGTPNVWQSATTVSDPSTLGVGGSTGGTDIFFDTGGVVTQGVHKTSTGSLNAEYQWTYSSSKINIYSPTDPNTRYTSVEIPQRDYGIDVAGSEYIIIDNFDVKFFTKFGIQGVGGSDSNKAYLTIKNCEVSYSGLITPNQINDRDNYGIHAAYSNMLIQNNTIHDMGRRAISMYNYGSGYTTRNITVEGNTLYRNYHTTGIDIGCSNGASPAANYDGIIIRNNLIYEDVNSFDYGSELINIESYSSPGIYIYNVQIYNNILMNTQNSGVHIYGVHGVNITHNTFYGHNANSADNKAFIKMTGAACTDVNITNNIFYTLISHLPTVNDLGVTLLTAPLQPDANIYMNYNIYYRVDPALRIISLRNQALMYNYGNFAGVQAKGWELQGKTGDPLFVDAANKNFHLNSTSPAKNAGTPITGITTDFEGNPYDTTHPSMGAFEYNGPTCADGIQNQGETGVDCGGPCSACPSVPTYYISNSTGVDNAGRDGSAGSPWRTLAYACGRVSTSGSVIHVNAGTYTETAQCVLAVGVSIEGSGTSSTRIISHYPSSWDDNPLINLTSRTINTNGNQNISKITFDGDNLIGFNAIFVHARGNVNISDCVFKNFFKNAVTFDGSTQSFTETGPEPTTWSANNRFYNNVLSNSALYDAPNNYNSGALQIGIQEGMRIYNNSFTENTRGVGEENGYCIKYYNQGFNRDLKIYNNTIIRAPQLNTGNGWNFAIELWHYRGGVDIYNNYIEGSIDVDHVQKGNYAYSLNIHNNTFGYNSFNPSTAWGNHNAGIFIEFGVVGPLNITNNTFRNLEAPITFTPRAGDSLNDIYIYNNIFNGIGSSDIDNTHSLVYWGSGGSGVTVNNLNFVNNIAYVNGGGAMYGFSMFISQQFASATNINVKNNVFQGFTGYPGYPVYYEISSGESIDYFNVSNNIFFGNGDNSVGGSGATHYTNQNNIISNPLFAGAATGNFHLSSGSPAINAGTNIPWVTTDKDGKTRNNPPDIGAYEYP